MGDEEQTDGKESRQNALLTNSFRDFLRGLNQFEKAERRTYRNRIRDRVRNGLQDFVILANHMEARDRHQLFVKDQMKNLHAVEPERAFRTDELNGAVHALAFIYASFLEMNADFEEYLTDAIAIAHHNVLDTLWVDRDIEVSIKDESGLEAGDAFEKLENNDELTEFEYYSLFRVSYTDTRRFIEETESIELPLEEAISEERRLSRGHSLVAFTRGVTDFDWLDTETLCRILDEKVLRDFGLSPVGKLAESETPNPEEVAEEL